MRKGDSLHECPFPFIAYIMAVEEVLNGLGKGQNQNM